MALLLSVIVSVHDQRLRAIQIAHLVRITFFIRRITELHQKIFAEIVDAYSGSSTADASSH
jgi:hypothetical protein